LGNVALASDIFQMSHLSSYIEALEYDVKLLPMDWVQLDLLERYDMAIDASKVFGQKIIPITDTLSPMQIKLNSSGARVFLGLDLKYKKETKEKIPKKSNPGKVKY
jgi:hypothetical protein|tara:strand:- start:52 stop:369 length:318 start_codon:yes stop_codon:yes gene_type:complete